MATKKTLQRMNKKSGQLETVTTELVKGNGIDHAAVAKAIKDFDAAWKTTLTGVVKVAKTEDKRLDTDSLSISKACGEYIMLANDFNNSRAIGSEENELSVDFKGLSAHIKELANETASRAFNKRVQRGVRHQLLAHVDGAKELFSFNDQGNLSTAANVLSPQIPSFDDGKQVGLVDNLDDTPTTVKTSDVDRMWKKYAPKVEKGPDQKSKDATEQQAATATKEQVLADFAHSIAGGSLPATKTGLQLIIAVHTSGITKADCMRALDNIQDTEPTAVAA